MKIFILFATNFIFSSCVYLGSTPEISVLKSKTGTKPSVNTTSIPNTGSVGVGTSSAVILFVPTYSSFGPCNALACSGASGGIQNRTITGCQKQSDGVNVTGALLSDCNSFNIAANTTTVCGAPAGNITNLVTGGIQSLSCLASDTVTSFVYSLESNSATITIFRRR